MSFFTS